MQVDKQRQALDPVRKGADGEVGERCVPSIEECGANSKAQANGFCIAGAIVDEWVDTWHRGIMCEGSLATQSNAKLTSLHELEGIASLGGNAFLNSLEITDIGMLNTIEELAGLHGYPYGRLVVQGNTELMFLHGLEGIDSIRGCTIISNNKLQSIKALSSISFFILCWRGRCAS